MYVDATLTNSVVHSGFRNICCWLYSNWLRNLRHFLFLSQVCNGKGLRLRYGIRFCD